MALLAVADCSGHALYDPIIPSEINWMQCSDCSHVFTDGYFSEEQNKALFSKVHAAQMPGYNIEKGRDVACRIVETVLNHVSHGTWLDVGFGDGALLMTAQEYGFDPVGIDARQDAVTELLKFGITAYATDLASYEAQGRFDVVSMADVLEHMPFPGAALARAQELLKPDGVLFISCPNSQTAAWRHLTATGQNPYWLEIEHFHNFSRDRLSSLLQEHGFDPVHYSVSHRYRMGMEIIARRIGSLIC